MINVTSGQCHQRSVSSVVNVTSGQCHQWSVSPVVSVISHVFSGKYYQWPLVNRSSMFNRCVLTVGCVLTDAFDSQVCLMLMCVWIDVGFDRYG